jgi:hypothetical protein
VAHGWSIRPVQLSLCGVVVVENIMYYKIVNQNSKYYKKLKALLEKEEKMKEENKQFVKDLVQLSFTKFWGIHGQQNYIRVTQYSGFVFHEPEKVDPKLWVKHKTMDGVYVPNKRTKAGREIAEALDNGIQKSWFEEPHDILGVKTPIGEFCMPVVLTCGDVLVLHIDDKCNLNNDEIIEITSKEFHDLTRPYVTFR